MDDVQPQTIKPIIDDQELAKVLAGVSRDDGSNFTYEETPVNLPETQPQVTEEPVTQEEPELVLDEPATTPQPSSQMPVSNEDLESIKKTALQELRPLVDKLDLSADEKFDIYLLLLRSTDDTTLIAPAHATAQQIEDEAKRAQALLDIIKEIDFLAKPI